MPLLRSLAGIRGGPCYYKHGAPNGAWPVSVVKDARSGQAPTHEATAAREAAWPLLVEVGALVAAAEPES